jgi:hypothetical protein
MYPLSCTFVIGTWLVFVQSMLISYVFFTNPNVAKSHVSKNKVGVVVVDDDDDKVNEDENENDNNE